MNTQKSGWKHYDCKKPRPWLVWFFFYLQITWRIELCEVWCVERKNAVEPPAHTFVCFFASTIHWCCHSIQPWKHAKEIKQGRNLTSSTIQQANWKTAHVKQKDNEKTLQGCISFKDGWSLHCLSIPLNRAIVFYFVNIILLTKHWQILKVFWLSVAIYMEHTI